MNAPSAPGFFIFTDQPGNSQRVRVERIQDELFAFFGDMDPNDEPVRVADMAGSWEPGFQSWVKT